MARMMFAYGNRTDDALLNDGAWTTTLPLVNLQNRTLGKVARSNDLQLSSTQFKADLQEAEVIRVVGLVNHNLSLDAQYRITSSETSDFAVLASDSGWMDLWPSVYPSEILDWEAINFWSGQYLPREIEGYTAEKFYILPLATRAQFWRVEMDDADNTSGYVQIGRLFIGNAWQPSRNMSVGAQIGLDDDTGVQRARSGAEYFDIKRRRRFARVTIQNIEDAESYGIAFEMMRQMGVSGEVAFIFDPDDTVHAIRRQWMGRLRQISPIEHPYPLAQSAAFDNSEIL